MKLSILTATYNRANILEKLYRSIINNLIIEMDVEWLIMDDGSSDDTKKILEKFVDYGNLKVKSFHQDNQGKMQAINNLMEYVTGDLVIECDDDDYFVDNSFNIIYEKCRILTEDENLYALVFLKNEGKNKLSGNQFAFEDKYTTMFDLYFKYDIIGEKVIVYNAEIRKKYKYILEKNEKFCTEARLHFKMDLNYKVKCFNSVIEEGEYLKDGYTRNIRNTFIRYPFGYYHYFKEILNSIMDGVKFGKRIYAIKHYILFEYLTKSKIGYGNIKGKLNRYIYILLIIPGRIKSRRFLSKE